MDASISYIYYFQYHIFLFSIKKNLKAALHYGRHSPWFFTPTLYYKDIERILLK
jgi:hypothetical protein